MMRRLLFGVILLVGCGSDGGGGTRDSNAPAECNALISALCAQFINCSPGVTQTDCVASAKTGLNCAAAVGVAASYSACISDINTTTCAALVANNTLNLPASCKGAILVSQ